MTLRLFGALKTLAQHQSEIAVPLPVGGRVKDLVELLSEHHPQISELIQKKKVLVSVNQEIAQDDTEIHERDEVALLPPFAGGGMETQKIGGVVSQHEDVFARVQRENFSVDEEIERVRRRSTHIGGITTFLGTARDRSRGREVSAITFEHYEGMAQKKLHDIRQRALREFDVLEVLIVHRFGPIQLGENIVLIVVGAEHRAEAFRACRWCIDELKQITPIWKLEHTAEGEVWVEEHP